MRKILLVSVLGILLLPALSFTDDSAKGRVGARFTGVFSDSGIDKNGDGYFEQLMVSGEIEIDSAVEGAVMGTLCSQDGRIISQRPDTFLTALMFSRAELVSDSGRTVFHIFFSGQDIRMRKTDGPFKAKLTLWCNDLRTYTTYETSAYSYTAFREHDTGQEDAIVFGMNLWELVGLIVLVVLLILLFWRIFRRRARSSGRQMSSSAPFFEV